MTSWQSHQMDYFSETPISMFECVGFIDTNQDYRYDAWKNFSDYSNDTAGGYG